ARGLACRTGDANGGARLDLDTVRATREKRLNATTIRHAAIEEFEWREPSASAHPFTIGIVEYDDQGMAWNDTQVARVKDLVSDAVAGDDALIVGFVHGWKNDCETCNGNLTC